MEFLFNSHVVIVCAMYPISEKNEAKGCVLRHLKLPKFVVQLDL